MGAANSKKFGGKMHPITINKMHLSEPWFSLIKLGIKDVEERLNKGKFKELKEGNIIEWYNDDFNYRSFLTLVTEKVEYKSFTEYLKNEKKNGYNPLPGIDNLAQELAVYYKYYSSSYHYMSYQS